MSQSVQVKHFGLFITKKIREKYKNTAQFCRASGIATKTINDIRKRKVPRIHAETIAKLAKAIDIEPDALGLILQGCAIAQKELVERHKRARESGLEGLSEAPIDPDQIEAESYNSKGWKKHPKDLAKAPRIEVKDNEPDISKMLGEVELTDAEADDLDLQMRRAAKMDEIAKERIFIAKNVHTTDDGQPLSFDKYPYQVAIYEDNSPFLVVGGSAQWGKAVPLWCLILTPTGWKKMGELLPGDSVMSPDGVPTTVTKISNIETLPMMRFTFEDGRTFVACTEHRWEVSTNGEHPEVITTQEMYDRLMAGKFLSIPLTKPQPMFRRDPLPIEPARLGRILLRGQFHRESAEVQNGLDELGLMVPPDRIFIPWIYLDAPIADRWELARGLLVDATPGSRGYLTTCSKDLVEGVQQLVWSLGGRAGSCDKRFDGGEFTVDFDFPLFPDRAWLGVSLILPIEPAEGRCIEVDDPRGLYVAENFIVTHNSKMTVADAAANAVCGVPVLYVISKMDKRDRFVGEEVDVSFAAHPYYQKALEIAKKRGADIDSKRQKGFGTTFINFIGSNSDRDFTSLRAGKAIIDEHDECVRHNIEKVDDRLAGYPWRFKLLVGHFTEEGGKDDRNLWHNYMLTDQRRWCVPCDKCNIFQELKWETHIVIIKKNEKGGIMDVKVRDPLWSNKRRLDPHPICTNCASPMNRLHKEGKWVQRAPQNEFFGHGYQLSNIYNCNVPLRTALDRFQTARFDPEVMTEFTQKYLGLPYTAASEKVTDDQITDCAAGKFIPQYEFQRVQMIRWNDLR